MSRTSKLLTPEVVRKAESGLAIIGKKGGVAIKLMAIISAKKNGITNVANVFGTTKATLIAWIKKLDESIEELSVQAGRGRKRLLSPEEEVVIKGWIGQDSHLTLDHLKIKIQDEFGVCMGRTTVHRLMKRLRFSYITPRPRHHKQDPKTFEESQKKSHSADQKRV